MGKCRYTDVFSEAELENVTSAISATVLIITLQDSLQVEIAEGRNADQIAWKN
jgi:hypothetical protein